MITKTEAGALLAIIDGKIPYIPFPHSRELASVAKAIKGMMATMAILDNQLRGAQKKLERKIRASMDTYTRLLEENRKVKILEDELYFKDCSESMPKKALKRFIVKLDNGDIQVDFLNENRTWRDNGKKVVKWANIPDDSDRRKDEVNNKFNGKKKGKVK